MNNVREYEYERPWLAPYQTRILDSPARFTVCVAATKTGKTASHIIWLLEKALFAKSPGQNFWWVAPIYAQAKIAWSRMKNQITNRTLLKSNETDLTHTLPNGSKIWFKTADKPENLFGEDVYAAVFDEYTRAKEAAYDALYSTLTATKGPCKFIGNAKGKNHWGYRLFIKAKNGAPDHEFLQINAYDAVDAGILSLEIIEQAKRDLSEISFKELYLAEFTDSGQNPFGYDNIRACVKPISQMPIAWYGVDLAKYSDWTVIMGLDKQGNIAYFDRFRMDWKDCRERIISVVGQKPAHIDSTGVGDAIVEDVARVCHRVKGVNYAQGHHRKQQLMEGLGHAIKTRTISVLEGVVQDELEGFEYEYENGRVKYSTLGYDDCVNAMALAQDCRVTNPGGGITWT